MKNVKIKLRGQIEKILTLNSYKSRIERLTREDLEELPSRKRRREAWFAKEFAAYEADKPDKIWESIDGEEFIDQGDEDV